MSPVTPPTSDWLISEARQIAVLLREQQDEHDVRGYYSDAIHRRLLEGGFYRILHLSAEDPEAGRVANQRIGRALLAMLSE